MRDSKRGNWSLQFLGATGTVTGSKYLLRAGDGNVLVDCGLFQGFKQLRLRNWAPLPIEPATVSAVVLSHAHVPIRAEVSIIDSFSAHADYTEILDWLKGFERAPRQTFITHGEPAAADALRHRVEESLGWSCRVPDYMESARLE
jgi:Cft2 family RNA processing exonuclease